MSTGDPSHHAYRFGAYALDIERGEVLRGGEPVRLRPKAFDVLRYLVERRGQLVGKDELLDAVWSPVVVTEDSVTQCLMEIRQALDDHDHSLIRTVPRRGYIFEAEVHGPEPTPEVDTGAHLVAGVQPTPTHRRRPLLLVLLAFLLLALWWRGDDRDRSGAAAIENKAAQPTSIAVLPFVDMSPRGDQAWFADGISEEILNRLAAIRDLRVIARTSSFAFKGKQAGIDEIAGTLGVDHVLEGSVRRNGNNVRITAQLIRAEDSSHLWSQTYDRTLENVLNVQDEIAAAVAAALEKRLAPMAGDLSLAQLDPQAYQHFMHGRYFVNRRAEGDLERALHHLNETVRLEPGFAEGWASLARVHFLRLDEAGVDRERALSELGRTAHRAYALDPGSAEANYRLGNFLYRKGRIQESFEYRRKAIALSPDDPLMLSVRAGMEMERGRHEEAVVLQRQAVVRDPLAPVHRMNLVDMLILAGRLSEAESELRALSALLGTVRPHMHESYAKLHLLQRRFEEALGHVGKLPSGGERDVLEVLSFDGLGRKAEAASSLERLRSREDHMTPLRLAIVQAQRGNHGAAFELLEQSAARVEEHPGVASAHTVYQLWHRMQHSPFLQPLHGDPRWGVWLARAQERLPPP